MWRMQNENYMCIQQRSLSQPYGQNQFHLCMLHIVELAFYGATPQ